MTDDSLAPESSADMPASYSSRIGLITDIHYTPDHADELDAQLQTALDHFEASTVDRIVVLGDLILEGETSTETRKRFHSLVTNLQEQTEIPVTVLRGNHDVTTGDGDSVYDLSLEPPEGTFELTDSITGISLDTSSPQWPDARGQLGDEQLSFLESELENADYAVVFSHHPLYYHDLSNEGHFAEHPEAAFAIDKYRASDLFVKYKNVLAAVNGHTHLTDATEYTHRAQTGRETTVPHFTINAMADERPGYSEPNGSFAVLDVSRSEVKRLSHRHGSFDSVDSFDYPAGNQTVALGGTFGPIHDGHRQMFQRAFEVGDVMVGLTSDDLAQKTRHTPRDVPSFEARKAALSDELDHYADLYDREYTINKLDDPMGVVADDPTYTHLIVSPETFARGEEVNEKRLENGHEPMSLEVVEPLLAEDGTRISSTRIVNGEIDEHGTLLDNTE